MKKKIKMRNPGAKWRMMTPAPADDDASSSSKQDSKSCDVPCQRGIDWLEQGVAKVFVGGGVEEPR